MNSPSLQNIVFVFKNVSINSFNEQILTYVLGVEDFSICVQNLDFVSKIGSNNSSNEQTLTVSFVDWQQIW